MGKEKGESSSEATSIDAREDREQWGGQIEFLLSCIGYCVGLGNVWRFPYLAYRNGGGAFLIPYLIMLVLCGIPLFMMELSLGQFSGLGTITAWRASPIFKGIGFGMVGVSFLVCIYYNVIIAYSLFYLFASFQAKLPWTETCREWNTNATCAASLVNKTVENITSTIATTMAMQSTTASPNATNTTEALKIKTVSPSEEYWKYRVLRVDKSTGIDDPGYVLWDLCLCLLLAWIIVFICLAKGVKSSGKVVYFTATFPYVILIILFIRGILLDGAIDGIRFYIIPKWELLGNSAVWKDAATQIFYSLGVAFGGLLTFASYNKFNNNLFRDTMIVSIGNCATSVFAGFVIFSVIGNMAKINGVDIEDVADEGPGLAFVAYPQAVSLLPIPQLWSALFFFMLFTLGLDSQFAMVETVVTGLVDEFPKFFRNRKTHLMLAVSIVAFLLGILLVTEGGIYWFNLYEWYSAYFGLLILSLFMCLAVNWGYGYAFTTKWRFNHDIKLMLGFQPFWYFKIAWMFVTPAMITFIILYSGIFYTPITFGDYKYPKWAENLGLCMSFSVCATVPLYMVGRMIVALIQGQSIRSLFNPSPRWGPSDTSVPYDPKTGGQPDVPIYSITNGESEKTATYEQYVTDDIPDAYSKL
ncbi:sodium-dependent proline transporter-like [Styela clava]